MITQQYQTAAGSRMEPLVSAPDAAAYLGRPVSWLYDRWRPLGIPAYRLGGRLSFRLSELDEWLEVHREPTPTKRRL